MYLLPHIARWGITSFIIRLEIMGAARRNPARIRHCTCDCNCRPPCCCRQCPWCPRKNPRSLSSSKAQILSWKGCSNLLEKQQKDKPQFYLCLKIFVLTNIIIIVLKYLFSKIFVLKNICQVTFLTNKNIYKTLTSCFIVE